MSSTGKSFEFETDDKSEKFCRLIIARMISLFGISADEALGRLNRDWRNLRLVGPTDLIYHEDEDYWAKTIYCGNDSNWWQKPPNLKPRAYP